MTEEMAYLIHYSFSSTGFLSFEMHHLYDLANKKSDLFQDFQDAISSPSWPLVTSYDINGNQQSMA